jgi:hypothetical protein
VGLHKAVLPPGVERQMERNPNGIHEFYYTDESGHRIGEQTTDLESGFRLGVTLARTNNTPVRIWIGSAQEESGWKQWGRVTPETTEEAIKRAVMLFALRGRQVNPESITPVIFRKWKDSGDVIALFPEEVADLEGNISSYMHVGQHGAASLQKVMQASVPAKPKEYAELKDELERVVGYRLRVVERDSPAFRAERRKQLREYRRGNPEPRSDAFRAGADFGREAARQSCSVGISRDRKEALFANMRRHRGLTDEYSRGFIQGWREVGYAQAHGVQNPDGGSESESAAALYEQFHGRPSSETLEYHEEIEVPDELAGLGDLTEIKVATMSGLDVTLSFEDDPPKLCSTPDGKQLHIIGGDASLPLDKLKMDGDKWLRDSMVIGVLYELTYRTQKDFRRFSLTDYFHKFADPKEKRSDVEPMLIYDSVNKQLSVSGGQYAISKPGIEG